MALFRRRGTSTELTPAQGAPVSPALAQGLMADEGFVESATTRLASVVLDMGIDGRGPFHSAAKVADTALKRSGTVEQAVAAVVKSHLRLAATSGFVTNAGGFVTLPVALPANVLGFYLVATRMTAAVARLRGHDLADPAVRSAVLLTLVGSDADELLRKAGMVSPTGRLAGLATSRLPETALMVVNKAVAFRLISGLGRQTVGRLGRNVPVVGGAVGSALDGWLLSRIADHAREEFPSSLPRPAGEAPAP